MLLWLVFLPLLGGLIGWLLEASLKRSFTKMEQCRIEQESRFFLVNKLKSELCYFSAGWVALLTMLIVFVMMTILSIDALTSFYQGQMWVKEFDVNWIPLLGIKFHLVLDGLSILMGMLVSTIVLIAILYSRKERPSSSGLFYFCLLFMASAIIMLFMAMDLFLWFFLWEAVAIPFYFLITLWGRRDSSASLKTNGASKFLVYTQITSLLMLLAIISLALTNWQITNEWTFDYNVLMKTPISSYFEFMLMLGFLAALVVRIPLLPFHNWFIDAHIEASTTGSIMISGLLVNTSIYGLLRFVFPLFPNASLTISPFIIILSLCTLFYMALSCFNQSDIKRLIAYAHIALMSFITAVAYNGSLFAYQGVVLLIISISLVIVGLFIISGLLTEFYLTRNINNFLGLKSHVKYLSTLTLFYLLAILGIPGTANFVGNFMTVFSSYQNSTYMAIFLIIGLILLSISIIVRTQPIFYGVIDKQQSNKKSVCFKDLFLLIGILVILFFIGLYPQWVLDISSPPLNKIQQIISSAQTNLIKGDV
ncbi:complex I subunit 4 family protein [Orbus mooreae]|uniref:complex I subunit 4 family protein n=1 Tax=Orbus mooreae TaxID=3074107 RepID=UPI00370DC969